MGDPEIRDASARWPAEDGESSWDRLTRLRRWRDELESVIQAEMPAAAKDARRHGVGAAELARAWGVSVARISQVAPVRTKRAK
ncbi:hypothetical protein CU254_42425 (plasmid) [Amycolatopsis sp. AA4]|uniref:hypothetical protein n=1 Tax=Actinomycetes TaxID=1760 RepID=UPI0001B5767B|nr:MULTISPECIES: hypothetical protein [Actinomycetes]ATY17245.1 hypothetical protein CU254_42425 [Amycolatopsis sp. AA4]